MTTVCLSRSKQFLFGQAHSIAAMADIVPTDKDNKDRTFTAFATDFNLDPKVSALILYTTCYKVPTTVGGWVSGWVGELVIECLEPGRCYLVPGTWHLVPGTKYLTSGTSGGTSHLVPGIWYGTWYRDTRVRWYQGTSVPRLPYTKVNWYITRYPGTLVPTLGSWLPPQDTRFPTYLQLLSNSSPTAFQLGRLVSNSGFQLGFPTPCQVSTSGFPTQELTGGHFQVHGRGLGPAPLPYSQYHASFALQHLYVGSRIPFISKSVEMNTFGNEQT